MRWKERMRPPTPQYGDIRYKDRFLLFPKKLEGEWRWLERALWKERYHEDTYYGGCCWIALGWDND